jgi:hypothetical protein
MHVLSFVSKMHFVDDCWDKRLSQRSELECMCWVHIHSNCTQSIPLAPNAFQMPPMYSIRPQCIPIAPNASAENSGLSCRVLFCPELSHPVLSCPVLSCPVLAYPIQSTLVHSSVVQSGFVRSCPIHSDPLLSCPVQSCPALSYPILCSPAAATIFTMVAPRGVLDNVPAACNGPPKEKVAFKTILQERSPDEHFCDAIKPTAGGHNPRGQKKPDKPNKN